MSKTFATPISVSRILPMILALAALFIWASIAHAQTEAQTYAPVDNSVSAADTSAGSGEAAEAAGNGAADDGAAASGSGSEADGTGADGTGASMSSGSGGAAGDGLGIDLLPSTGGPLLPLAGLGAVALGATGLLVRRRYSRQ